MMYLKRRGVGRDYASKEDRFMYSLASSEKCAEEEALRRRGLCAPRRPACAISVCISRPCAAPGNAKRRHPERRGWARSVVRCFCAGRTRRRRGRQFWRGYWCVPLQCRALPRACALGSRRAALSGSLCLPQPSGFLARTRLCAPELAQCKRPGKRALSLGLVRLITLARACC